MSEQNDEDGACGKCLICASWTCAILPPFCLCGKKYIMFVQALIILYESTY